MITNITFILDPPLGRYSSGTCVTLLARLPHPAAPSMVAPAAPAPATLRKSLRVSVRPFTPRLRVHAGRRGPRASRVRRGSLVQRASSCSSTRAFPAKSNQPPKIVANSAPIRRACPHTRAGGKVGLMYARQTTLGKDGYVFAQEKFER